MWRRLRLVFVTITLLLSFAVRYVSAHANLSRSIPPANASLDQSPTEIRLWFTETLEPEFSRFTLLDSSGRVVTTTSSQVASTDPTQMFMEPNELPDGLYTVAWRVVSVDGHSTEGSLAFGVRVAIAPTTILPTIDQSVPVESAVIRWFNLLSMSVSVGSIGFYLFVWMPAVPAGHIVIERRMMILMWFGWIMVGVAGVFTLLLQSSIAAGVPISNAIGSPVIGELLNGTRYGQIWLARQIFWLGMGAVLYFAHGERWLYWCALLLGGQLLLTTSLYSHASSVPQDVTASVAGDWLHLAATALWLGGLVQFANIISPTRRYFNTDTTAISSLVSHFSNFARVAIAAILISGFYAAWLQVGTVEGLVTTVYGRALFIKLILVLPLLAVSGINLLFTQRGLNGGHVIWVSRLRGLVGAEIALVIGIAAAVGVMTAIAPARTVLAVQNVEIPELADGSFFEMQTHDDLMTHLEFSPGYVGDNRFFVSLFDTEGNPITDATLVRLRFDNLQQNLGQSELRLESQTDGTYAANGSNLSVSGQWRIRMTVQRPEQFDAIFDYELEVRPPAAPPAPIINTDIPTLERFLASLIAGVVLLAIGGFFAAQVHPRWLSGAGVTTVIMLAVGGIFLLTSATNSGAITGRSGALDVYDAWSLPVPMGMTGGVYLTLENGTDQTQQLIGATTDVAASVQIHQTQITDNIARMNPMDAIDIPSGSTLRIMPGSYHIMLVDMKRDLSWDDTFPITLNFASGEQITLTVIVQDGTE